MKAADFFVDSAANLGKHFGMSKLMIGLTIVAVGTSLPEAITSLASILFTENFSDFLVGTVMGSNITNILLAFGIFLVVARKFETRKREMFNVASLIFTTLVFSIFVMLGYINPLVISLFIFYIFYLLYLSKYQKKEIEHFEEEVVDDEELDSKSRSVLILIASFIGLFIGAKLIIYSVENVGRILSIPTAYLTLTTISVATSLPELAVTIASAKKKEYLIGIGNILGTNVMNIGIIVGLSGFYGTFLIDSSLYVTSTIIYLLATLIFSILIIRRKFSYHYGYLFLFIYLIYLGSFFF